MIFDQAPDSLNRWTNSVSAFRSNNASTYVEQVSLEEASRATWSSVDLSPQLNGNLSLMFHPEGGYVEPRPATCSARIGTDGWSAWTFTYGQGNAAPFPGFFENYTASGSVTTPQGAQFQLRAKEQMNVSILHLDAIRKNLI